MIVSSDGEAAAAAATEGACFLVSKQWLARWTAGAYTRPLFSST
jgi:hypothetical protein